MDIKQFSFNIIAASAPRVVKWFFTCFRHATLCTVSLRQMRHLSESRSRSLFPGLLWVLLKQKSENALHLATWKTIGMSGLCKQIFQNPLCAFSVCNEYRIHFSVKSRGTFNHCNSTYGYMWLRIDFHLLQVGLLLRIKGIGL